MELLLSVNWNCFALNGMIQTDVNLSDLVSFWKFYSCSVVSQKIYFRFVSKLCKLVSLMNLLYTFSHICSIHKL